MLDLDKELESLNELACQATARLRTKRGIFEPPE